MHDWRSLSHVRWECKYHVVITPKYRKKVFFGKRWSQIGEILRELCRQRKIELLEAHAIRAMIGSNSSNNCKVLTSPSRCPSVATASRQTSKGLSSNSTD